MSAICSNPMVRGLAVLFCAFVLGCGDDEDGGGGGAPGCSAGFERADDGRCVLASGGCAANQLRSLRTGQCVGAGWASCPEGFEANAEGTSCEPVLTTSCAAGTRPVLGASSCAPVGFSDCPAGFTAAPWGCVDVLPDAPCTGATRDAIGSEICLPVGDCNAAFPPPDATAFVDDSFTAGELDATHFLTVGEAVAAASPSAVIAVESGTYAEALYVDRAISLVGRCPAEVVLQGNAVDAGIEVDGASGALVRGFRVRGHYRGVIVRGAGSLELIDSIVEDNDNEGILSTEASTLTVRGSVVRGTQPVDGSQFGFGVELNAGSSVELVATAVVDNHKFAVQLTGASTSLSMTDSVIRATRRDATGDFGLAMLIRSGASATISESVIAENYESGIVALGSGSNLTISRSVLRDTLANITGYGRGIDVETGAHASLTDVTFLRHREAAVLSTGAGTEVSLDRVTIEDTRPDAAGEHGTAVVAHEGGSVLVTDSALIRSGDQAIQVDHPDTVAIIERSIAAITGEDEGTFGRGLSAFGGAHVTLSECALLDNREAGALVSGAGTELSASRCVVARTTGGANGSNGRGISVQGGARLVLSSSLLEDNREIGLFALGGGTDVSVEHTLIRRTEPQVSDGAWGRGMMVQGGARVVVGSSALVDNTEVGVVVSGAGSGLELRDAFVSGTRPTPLGRSGVALVAQLGAGALLERVAVTEHRVASLVANGEGTTVVVSGSFIRGTQPGQGEEEGFAHGVVAVSSAVLSLSEVELSQNVGIGVAFSAASGLLDACLLEKNGVGLHVQGGTQLLDVSAVGPGVPFEVHVTDSVRFVDNGVRFGAETLPMPDPVAEAAPEL